MWTHLSHWQVQGRMGRQSFVLWLLSVVQVGSQPQLLWWLLASFQRFREIQEGYCNHLEKWIFSVMKREKGIMLIFSVPGQQNWVNSTLVTLEISRLHVLLTTAWCVTNKRLEVVQADFCSEEKVENRLDWCMQRRKQGLTSKWPV